MADRLDDLARDALPVLCAGANAYELPTDDGSPRWGLSANLRFDPGATRRIAELTAEVGELVGPGHWPTGAERSSHLTLRPLEPHRADVPDDDDALARYAAALAEACRGSVAVRLSLGPVGLTRTGVLLAARPLGSSLDRLYARLDARLGPDGWFQHGIVRDLWYVSLLHFGAAVDEGQRLAEWVTARRALDAGTARCVRAQIIHWRLADGRVTARPLVDVPLRDPEDDEGRTTGAGHG